MGKHSDFRISSIQVVNARRILQLNRKTEKYFKVFIWLGGMLLQNYGRLYSHQTLSWAPVLGH